MYDEKCLLRIGSNIKLLRSVRQLNQHQLAERLGISQTHLSNIEHNNVLVSLKLLVRSANVLGCTLETLLDRKAAAEWAQAHDAEADEQAAGAESERVTETAAAETDEQEQYSLEEVRLLLKLLQIQRNICSYR
ncbi:helix-turn-helix domain-containing protein [uncultured Phascolarctobacterium sp.]|uniref:helix-turn-helix domain-containing protein n=1 Tax=uncultured Phascolarctobacterium sp. TaxID=512296 RepID=UPI002595E8F3|nr:helix-turn-helix transcriptional regulator [uncultured Phascolarctobacterium sp.]